MNSVDFPEFERHAPDPGFRRKIWRTFVILLLVTIVDFAIYFGVPPSMLKNITFVVIGIAKAYYIIGIFMHMKFERTALALIILVPVMFICALILASLYEGWFWHGLHWGDMH
jgi:cytochrome c oxidase subunit 4